MIQPVLRIHIGFHKTGTSSTQIALAEQAEAGLLPVLYPLAGRLENWAYAHHQLVEDLRHGNRDSLDAIVVEHRSQPDLPILLSSEDFSMVEAGFTLAQVRQAFPDHRLEIIAVVRNHVDWLRSYYMERVKRNSTQLSPMQFVREHLHTRRFSPALHLARALGGELQLFNYDALTLPAGLFPSLAGVEMQVDAHTRWNRSLTPQATFALLHAYRAGVASQVPVNRVIHNAFKLDQQVRQMAAAVDIFTPAEIAEIHASFADDRAEVNALAGHNVLPDDIPVPKGPHMPEDPSAEAVYLRAFLGNQP
ncbi:hypothetical protein [Algicella marina]|uniref:Sulfotransferase family protein n=1 Tax=Algicella marina TaxID=2683284 RepID=A0A6P1T433_9RHOB|nr:hypothetical protein [Algicella marina]QHQ36460.1 hypothetical protein GO499_15390 [Algicella marina]